MNKILGALMIIGLFAAAFILTGCTQSNPTGTPLSIGDTNTMSIPTNVTCNNVQDCVIYAQSQDATATNIQATCDKTCTFITEKTPTI